MVDLTTNRRELRGLLRCVVEVAGAPIHCFCTHLNLLHRGRRVQYRRIIEWVRSRVADDAPMILAGDFNDWSRRASPILEDALGVVEAHRALHGQYARTFPPMAPVLTLDRIYVRGLWPVRAGTVDGARALHSDHLGLTATLQSRPGG